MLGDADLGYPFLSPRYYWARSLNFTECTVRMFC